MTNRPGSVYIWTTPGGTAIVGDPSASSITLIFANVGGAITVRETNAAGCITNHKPFGVTLQSASDCNDKRRRNNLRRRHQASLTVDFTGTAPTASLMR